MDFTLETLFGITDRLSAQTADRNDGSYDIVAETSADDRPRPRAL